MDPLHHAIWGRSLTTGGSRQDEGGDRVAAF
uniref:Uncharacterized protein n=1 Tax=Peronospora matthiolae TaxID=2874970 RepID=A0AAV1TAF5_9STRA